MSSVSAISGVSSLWDTSSVNAASSTSDTYSQLLNSVSKASTGSGSGSGSSDASDTVTITKVQPDGSIMILVMKGEQVVSEYKVGGAAAATQQNLLASSAAQSSTAQSSQITDRFIDTSASSTMEAGSLFSASV